MKDLLSLIQIKTKKCIQESGNEFLLNKDVYSREEVEELIRTAQENLLTELNNAINGE